MKALITLKSQLKYCISYFISSSVSTRPTSDKHKICFDSILYAHIYIYVYIETEREREKETERDRGQRERERERERERGREYSTRNELYL